MQFAALWAETLAVVRRHADLMLPVAGMFLFLPQLLLSRQIAERPPRELFSGPDALLDMVVLPLALVAGIVGQLILYFLAINNGTGGLRLGQVVRRSVSRLLPAIAVSLVQAIAVGVGLMLFIVPGLWMMARFVAALPLVATTSADPVKAMQQSWALTNGRSLQILGMLTLLISAFLLISMVFVMLGTAFGLMGAMVPTASGAGGAGWGIGRWLFELATTAAATVFGLYYACFAGRLTRNLRGSDVG